MQHSVRVSIDRSCMRGDICYRYGIRSYSTLSAMHELPGTGIPCPYLVGTLPIAHEYYAVCTPHKKQDASDTSASLGALSQGQEAS